MTNDDIYTLELDRYTINKLVWACNKVSIDNLEDDKEAVARVWEAIAENIKAQVKAQDETQTEPEPEPEEQPTEDQQTTFEMYDEIIAHADTLEEARNLEEIVDYNHHIGLLTDTQRAALIGACLYMEQQLKAGKKPEDIPHRRK